MSAHDNTNGSKNVKWLITACDYESAKFFVLGGLETTAFWITFNPGNKAFTTLKDCAKETNLLVTSLQTGSHKYWQGRKISFGTIIHIWWSLLGLVTAELLHNRVDGVADEHLHSLQLHLHPLKQGLNISSSRWRWYKDGRVCLLTGCLDSDTSNDAVRVVGYHDGGDVR